GSRPVASGGRARARGRSRSRPARRSRRDSSRRDGRPPRPSPSGNSPRNPAPARGAGPAGSGWPTAVGGPGRPEDGPGRAEVVPRQTGVQEDPVEVVAPEACVLERQAHGIDREAERSVAVDLALRRDPETDDRGGATKRVRRHGAACPLAEEDEEVATEKV